MIGVGIYELGAGTLLAAVIVYLLFCTRVSSLRLVLLIAVLSPIVGLFIGVFVAIAESIASYALFGG